MKFSDEINIYVASGKGGNGLYSFLKTKNSKSKTPDGGNGGNGGSVYIVGNKNYLTLNKLKFKKQYKAEDGSNGEKNNKTGKNGKNLKIEVPIGTKIYDNERNFFIGEINKDKEKFLVAKGGLYGYGNKTLNKIKDKKDYLTFGGKSEIKFLHLEMIIIADIGLLGMPNVGKSSLINKLSKSKSKVDTYEFTTINPVIGILKNFKERIVIADIPGIIKNASKGKGLGHRFLKHLTKTKIIFHIIDANKEKNIKFLKNLIIINKEIQNFKSDTLTNKKKWLILNKIDLIDKFKDQKTIKNFEKKKKYESTFFISTKNNIGIKKLSFNINEYFLKNKYV